MERKMDVTSGFCKLDVADGAGGWVPSTAPSVKTTTGGVSPRGRTRPGMSAKNEQTHSRASRAAELRAAEPRHLLIQSPRA